MEGLLRRAARTTKQWFLWALPFVVAVTFYSWAQKNRSIFDFNIEALGVAILALLITYVVIERAFTLSVTQISTPEVLQKLGWTTQVCSNRIAEILTMVSKAADLPDFPLNVGERLPNISVKLGPTEFGSDALIKFVSRMFGIASTEISGEAVIGDGATGSVSMRLQWNDLRVEQGPVPVSQFENLLRSVAATLAQQRAPFATTVALIRGVALHGYRPPEVVTLALQVAHDGANRNSVKPKERVLCQAMKALILLIQLKDGLAEEALQRAEKMGKGESLVKAIRYHLNREIPADDAAADSQQTVKMPEYDSLQTLESLVLGAFYYRLAQRMEEFLLKRAMLWLDKADKSFAQAEKEFVEAQANNWRSFDDHAEDIARLLNRAEGEIKMASPYTDANPELCEQLSRLQLKLNDLKGKLSEVEASPGYIAAVQATAELHAKVQAIVEDTLHPKDKENI